MSDKPDEKKLAAIKEALEKAFAMGKPVSEETLYAINDPDDPDMVYVVDEHDRPRMWTTKENWDALVKRFGGD